MAIINLQMLEEPTVNTDNSEHCRPAQSLSGFVPCFCVPICIAPAMLPCAPFPLKPQNTYPSHITNETQTMVQHNSPPIVHHQRYTKHGSTKAFTHQCHNPRASQPLFSVPISFRALQSTPHRFQCVCALIRLLPHGLQLGLQSGGEHEQGCSLWVRIWCT